MLNFDNFLNENVEQAKSFLNRNNIPETDPLYVGIRELTKGKEGYVGWLTKMAYDEFNGRGTDAILRFIDNLLKKITNDKQIIDLMDKPVIQYESYEKFIDGYEKASLIFKAKKIYNEFPKKQKDFLNLKDINVISLLSKLYDDKTNPVFVRKISSYKSTDELLSGIKRFLDGDKNNDFDKILDNLETQKLPLIYVDETNSIIIARILNYDQCRVVGSKTSWCIARDQNTFNSYVKPGSFDRQYIIYLTDLPISDNDRIIGATFNLGGYSTAHDVIDSHVSYSELSSILKNRGYNIDMLKLNKNNISQEDIDKTDFLNLLKIMTYDDILKLKKRYKEKDLTNIKEEDIVNYNINDKKELKIEELKNVNREDFFSKNILGRLIPSSNISIFNFINCGLTKEDIQKNSNLILTKIIDKEQIEDYKAVMKLSNESPLKSFKYGGYYGKTYSLSKTISTLKFYNKTKDNGIKLDDLIGILIADYSYSFRMVLEYLKYANFNEEIKNQDIIYNFFTKIYDKGHWGSTLEMIEHLYENGYKCEDKLISHLFFDKNGVEFYYSDDIISEYKFKILEKMLEDNPIVLEKVRKYNKYNTFRKLCVYLSGKDRYLRNKSDFKDITEQEWVSDWSSIGLNSDEYHTPWGSYNNQHNGYEISYILLLIHNDKFDLLKKLKIDWTRGKKTQESINTYGFLYNLVSVLMDITTHQNEPEYPIERELTSTQRYKASEWLFDVYESLENKEMYDNDMQLLFFAYNRLKLNDFIDNIKNDESIKRLEKLTPLLDYLITDKYIDTFYYKLGNFDRYIDLNYILKRYTTDNKLNEKDIEIMNNYYKYNKKDSRILEIILKYIPIDSKLQVRRTWENVISDYSEFINENIKYKR